MLHGDGHYLLYASLSDPMSERDWVKEGSIQQITDCPTNLPTSTQTTWLSAAQQQHCAGGTHGYGEGDVCVGQNDLLQQIPFASCVW